MESDVDATTLACIAFSCPNLESMEIAMSESTVNRITGDELSRFVGDKPCLASLKMEGCSNLGSIIVSSSSLTILWLSDLNCLYKMAFCCPNLQEVSLDFSRQGNDNTDITAMVDGLGRGCPMLQNIHIASARLTHKAVLALTSAGLRSSISDSGIGMICGVYPETLSRLLLALCPDITSSGIQFATAQLPLLELMDCGMTVSYPDPQSPTSDEDLDDPVGSNKKSPFTGQKLIVKHDRAEIMQALYLNCPKLNDLNLNSCRNLQPRETDVAVSQPAEGPCIGMLRQAN